MVDLGLAVAMLVVGYIVGVSASAYRLNRANRKAQRYCPDVWDCQHVHVETDRA